MDITERYLQRDKKSIAIIVKERQELIKKGCYPKSYRLPVTLQLELTSKCNLHCKHCYNRSGYKKESDLVTPEKWVSFCRSLVSKGGILQATISGGEPLLLGNHLWEIMDILHDDGTVFNLISNGYLMDKNIIYKLLKYRFYWVQISIDSYCASLHDEFRGVEGSWEKAAKAAYLIALSGIPLRIASTITPRDLDHLEDFVKMAINLGAAYFIIGEVMPSGRAFDNVEIFLTKENRNFFYQEMEKLTKKYKNDISILTSNSTKTQLEYASTTTIDGAIIRPDGNIRLDCTAPFVIGNILTDDIEAVWKEKSGCWQHPEVKKYIESCSSIDGNSSYIRNYDDVDIKI